LNCLDPCKPFFGIRNYYAINGKYRIIICKLHVKSLDNGTETIDRIDPCRN